MKTLIILFILTISNISFAATFKLKSGDTYMCQEKGQSVSCNIETCKISYKFVTKEYQVWTPKEKVFSSHKKETDALDSAAKLISLKVCNKLDLHYKDEK